LPSSVWQQRWRQQYVPLFAIDTLSGKARAETLKDYVSSPLRSFSGLAFPSPVGPNKSKFQNLFVSVCLFD